MKIRFTDTGEIIVVTNAWQLFNTEFVARNKAEAIKAIESLGFKADNWDNKHSDKNRISLWEDLVYLSTALPTGYRQFEFLSPTDPSTREIVRDIEILEEGEAWVKEQDRINGEPNGWISVDDKTPEPYKQVLALVTYGAGNHSYVLTHWNTRTECFDHLMTDEITHWQPLPPVPKTLNS
jgi:hypothetical protein